ncbi:MAG: valine--tRNA ligase [Planctomycetota bacterium]|nr:valine--tRNA ligase [Planctomycetota bacterium]
MLDGAYDPKTLDPAAQALWDAENVHAFDRDSDAPVYSIDTPPPTVSGSLHVGHVFSYTQAECIARYQRMRGRNVFYPFGFDDNGLPTERLAEKEHGVLGRELPRAEFVDLCRKTSAGYKAEFADLWRSLGVSTDWSLQYSTIDERSIRISQRAFLDAHAKGEVYLKTSPTIWDTETRTAVAQAELESKPKRTKMNHLRFDLVAGGHIEIATTRPELLAACVTVFIHPDHPRANELLGQAVRVPLNDHVVQIRADDKVDPEKGTGVVMCCTFGDKTDVEWYQKHNLDLRQVIAPDGTLTALAGPEAGLYANQARKAILERLEAAGHLLKQEDIENVVNVFERTGREIEFLPTRQWFVKVLDKKAKLLELGERIRWFPDHMGKRYRNWVEGLDWDWCISRQRFFGVPFPIWFCVGCEHVFTAPEAWLPVLDHARHAINETCPQCGGTTWRPETDVMDTWATSSETPSINQRWGEHDGEVAGIRPMTLRPQAHDIIRTWAFYTIVKAWIHHGDIPWSDVMVSGHVQAPGKVKISKSKSNAPTDPRTMIAEHGADATRYWALSATLGNDYVYNEEDFKQGRRLCVKLWNAAKLAQQHLEGFERSTVTAPPEAVDTAIRAALADTVRVASADLERYEFGIAKGSIERFFWNELCDNYLEMIKDRLYDESEAGAAGREAARAGLHDVLEGVTRLLAPFVPHVCEAVHQALFRRSSGVASIGRAPWPRVDVPPGAAEARAAWDAGLAVLTVARRWRSESKVSPGKPLARVRLRAAPDVVAHVGAVEAAVRAAGRIAVLEIAADPALPVGGTALEQVEPAE